MRKLLIYLSFCYFFVACSSTKNISADYSKVDATTVDNTNDGLSYDTAIFIKERTERAGVDAEYVASNVPISATPRPSRTALMTG